ncbi:MAG: sugar diacid recognition domain-containing protein [Paenibacillaceae bacterium]
MLTSEVANNIVQETMNRLDRNINIINTEGYIIASGDPSRVGKLHVAALEAIQSGQTIVINENNQHLWVGALCGINMPVSFQDQIVGAIGITGEPEEISEFAELVRMTTELMLNQSFQIPQQVWRSRTKEVVMEQLIKPTPDLKQIDKQLQLLSMELRPPYYAFVLRTDNILEYNSMLLQRTEDIYGSHHVLIGLLDAYRACIFVFGLSDQVRSQKLETWLDLIRRSGVPFQIGCSNEATKREDIASIIEEAEFALKHGVQGQQMILYAGLESQMIALQSKPLTNQRFLERVLTRMSESAVQTLQAFFDCNMNIQETANALFLHKNTIVYRLKRVKEITGYDPQIFRDALALQIAIWIYTETQLKEGSA